MTRTGKRYLVDTSLVAGALGLDERAVLRDGDLLGGMIDTFVLAQPCVESVQRPDVVGCRSRASTSVKSLPWAAVVVVLARVLM